MTERKVWRIAVIPGDGIGTEVVREGQRVVDALAEDSGGAFAFEWESFPWGSHYYLEHGRMMTEDALETRRLRRHILRRRGVARGARSREPVGAEAGDLPGVRPVRQRPSREALAWRREPAPRRERRDDGLGRRPREQRGRILGSGRTQPERARAGQGGGDPDGAV